MWLVGIGPAEHRIGLRASAVGRDRHRRLQVEAVHALSKLLATEQRAARRPGGHGGKGAAGQGAEPVLAGEDAAGGKDAPANEIASTNLADGACLDDFGPVVARTLGLPLPDPRRRR